MARPVAATVITRDDKVLLMWRHRHVTDTWGWEIPAGRVEDGETPEHAAAREAEEETGWRPGALRLLVASQPSNGSIDTTHYIFHGDLTNKHPEPHCKDQHSLPVRSDSLPGEDLQILRLLQILQLDGASAGGHAQPV
jgi:8-oxo-dGTP pyrophosphatase MutT (NUDIX family)